MNQRLRAFRESLHLTRAAFGARLGLSEDSINNLERGRVELKDSTIKLICSEYRISEQVFPACAGVIPFFAKYEKAFRGFPRMRGGDPTFPCFLGGDNLFSPHARG